jgi:glutaminyl-tRNA synthetase
LAIFAAIVHAFYYQKTISMSEEKKEKLNFIEEIIEEDIKNGKHDGRVLTRFPPEPNGYLHIGHAKAITLNFEIAERHGGKTNLRFDDTNPEKEKTDYVNAIKEDIAWLGFEWAEELYTSDYFDQLYEFAKKLIRDGNAYVDDSTSEEMAAQKGTVTEAGTNSPYRDRSPEENLDLFERMKNGEFEEGSHVLRAKIDMSHPNMNMRDPVLYRVKKAHHHRTGDKWLIYPMYDMAHGQSDSIEEITHSLCSLEFENHRPLYDWLIEKLEIFPSRQIEFSRLNMSYTIMSKRRLLRLVEEGHVNGWDDPRMPTISGMRRRGYTPEAIRVFINKVGLTKRANVIDVSLLEFCVRDHLNKIAPRVMAVLDPLKVVITNYPEDKTEMLDIEINPEDPDAGSRQVPFSREIYIERGDFMEDPPKKYFRMGPGRNVRLKGAYILHCEDYVKDDKGKVTEVHCTYYPDSRSGQDTSGVKAKGTLHFVSVKDAIPVEVRQYDRLFSDEAPARHKDRDFTEFLNPHSLDLIETAYAEPWLANAEVGDRFQFLRLGYFCMDPDSTGEKPVFNRTVTLRDSWAKMKKK